MKPLILAAFIAVAGTAAQADELWIVAQDEHHVMVVDADSIAQAGPNVRRMTSHMVSDDFGQLSNGVQPTFTTSSWEFDCAGHRRRELTLSFSDRNWNEIGSSDEVQQWDPVLRDSNGESEMNFACGHPDSDARRAPVDDFRRLAPMLLQQLETGAGGGGGSSKT